VVSWISYFFNFFSNLFFFFHRKHIAHDCMRDTKMILWTIQNSIQICGWRLDLPVHAIEIGFTVSPTLRPRICEQAIVSWTLGPRNRDRARNLHLSRQLYKNRLKLRQPNLELRRSNWGIKWKSSSDCWKPSLVPMLHLIAP